jgi:hypothetical protein
MKKMSTNMLQIPRKMIGSNFELQNVAILFQLQNAANCKENGQNSRSKIKNPKRKKKKNKTSLEPYIYIWYIYIYIICGVYIYSVGTCSSFISKKLR